MIAQILNTNGKFDNPKKLSETHVLSTTLQQVKIIQVNNTPILPTYFHYVTNL